MYFAVHHVHARLSCYKYESGGSLLSAFLAQRTKHCEVEQNSTLGVFDVNEFESFSVYSCTARVSLIVYEACDLFLYIIIYSHLCAYFP